MAQNRGFTLLEMMIVLMLFTVITVAIIPVYSTSMTSVRVRSARDDLVATLAFAMEKAVSQGREHRVYIDTRENVYWVMYLEGYDADHEKIFEDEEERYGEPRRLPEYFRAERVKGPKDRTLGTHYIACYPNGACTQAEVVLVNQRARNQRVKIKTLGFMNKIVVEQ